MKNPEIKLAFDTHRDQAAVSLNFEKDYTLIGKVKTIKGATWSQSRKFWYIPHESFNLNKVFEKLKDVANLDHSAIENENSVSAKGEVKNNKEDRGNSSIKNIEIKYIDVRCNEKEKTFYLSLPFALKEQFKKLEGAWWHLDLRLWLATDTIENREQLKEILLEGGMKAEYKIDLFVKSKKGKTPKPKRNNYKDLAGLSEVHKVEIETFYIKMKGINYEIANLERPIEGLKLPKVIPIETVQKMLVGIVNIKHKTALTTIYSLGLRRSELLQLKLTDISFKRDVVEIINAKGKKDRDLPLPKKLKELITTYYRQEKPLTWLIEGQTPGKPYSASSLENIFKNNMAKVMKNNNFTLHSLRHTGVHPVFFGATHLMDMGVDLRIIQELLGHKSSRTT